MNIGSLTDPIDLQQSAPTRDEATGQELPGWTAPERTWAKVQYGAGGEAVANSQKQAVQQVKFLIRWRPDALNTTFRVTYGGQYYDIDAVALVGRKSGLLLTANTRS
jgi:SPP1 family predicted phage head-tail adaptor